MSISSVKSDLDRIGVGISENKALIDQALGTLRTVSEDFSAYPARFADTIAEIQSYTDADAFEELCAVELSRFTAEFTEIQTAVSAAIAALE